jgi:hypothetical protein
MGEILYLLFSSEGFLDPSISLLENGKDIILTPQLWEGSYTYK